MALRLRLSAASRTFVYALFACALLVRVLVPAGWMPGDAAQAGTLQLCFDAGSADAATLAQVKAELAQHKLPEGGDRHADKHCDFAASAHALLTPHVGAPVASPSVVESTALALAAPAAPGRGLAAPPPPATGPPSLA